MIIKNTLRKKQFAIFLILFASILGVTKNICLKIYIPHIEASKIIFFQSLLGLFCLTISGKLSTQEIRRTPFKTNHIIRSLVLYLGIYFTIHSIKHHQILLSQASSILLISPLLSFFIGKKIFKERNCLYRILYFVTGLCGALIVLNPIQNIHFSYPILFLITAAIFFSSSTLIQKYLSHKDSVSTCLFYLFLTHTIISAIPTLISWETMSFFEFKVIIFISILIGCHEIFYITAYRYTELSLLTPFKFIRFPLSIFADIFFFYETPLKHHIFGGMIIISSLLLLHYTEKKEMKLSTS